jgi:hypothetical protein
VNVTRNLAAVRIALGLGGLQLFQALYLRAAGVAEMEMAQPSWLAVQDKLCRPRFALTLLLGSSETVDIGSITSLDFHGQEFT